MIMQVESTSDLHRAYFKEIKKVHIKGEKVSDFSESCLEIILYSVK